MPIISDLIPSASLVWLTDLVHLSGMLQPGKAEGQIGCRRVTEVGSGGRYVEELVGLDDVNHIL